MFQDDQELAQIYEDFNLSQQDLVQKEKKSDEDLCIQCETDLYFVEDFKQGVIVCSKCGYVATRTIIHNGAEWRNYDGDTKTTCRASGIVNHYLPVTSMDINIGGSKNSYLKMANNWANKPYAETKIKKTMAMIEEFCAKNNIWTIVQEDMKINYCKLSSMKHPHGKNKGKPIILKAQKKTGFMAACLNEAYKKNGINKTIRDMAELFKVPPKVISEGRKKYNFYVMVANKTNTIQHPKTSITSDYIFDFCEKLKIEEKYYLVAKTIADNMQKVNYLTNHKPTSVAASIIYLVCRENKLLLSKKNIFLMLSISEVTLTKLSDLISKNYNKLINTKYIDEKLKDEEVRKKHAEILQPPQKLSDIYHHLKMTYPEIFEKN